MFEKVGRKLRQVRCLLPLHMYVSEEVSNRKKREEEQEKIRFRGVNQCCFCL